MAQNQIDVHVGQRVRIRRMELEITQQRLAKEINVTFQQVQKYERGVNRISASKLFRIAELFSVSVDFFFEGLSEDGSTDLSGFAEEGTPFVRDEISALMTFLSSHEGMELNQAFRKLKRTKVRRDISNLVEAIASAEDEFFSEINDD